MYNNRCIIQTPTWPRWQRPFSSPGILSFVLLFGTIRGELYIVHVRSFLLIRWLWCIDYLLIAFIFNICTAMFGHLYIYIFWNLLFCWLLTMMDYFRWSFPPFKWLHAKFCLIYCNNRNRTDIALSSGVR